jgi:hypothetical protein
MKYIKILLILLSSYLIIIIKCGIIINFNHNLFILITAQIFKYIILIIIYSETKVNYQDGKKN